MSFKDKVKSVLSKPVAKLAGAVGAASAVAMNAFAAHAEGTAEGVSAAQTLMSNITSTLNISNAVAIISAGIGAVLGLFLAWWGARKLANMVITVFRKGKIRF